MSEFPWLVFPIILSEGWWQGIWMPVSAVLLAFTLGYVIKYTAATSALAKATEAMATAQREEVALRRRPVVTFECLDYRNFYFHTE